MPVKYVRVRTTVEGFSPISRATGNLAIIGTAPQGDENDPVEITAPSDATKEFGDAFGPVEGDPPLPPPINSALTRAIQTAFRQSPGPSRVWGIRSGVDLADAFVAAETLPVQFVVVADTALDTETAGPAGAIRQLVDHVVAVSDNGDGKERIGVAMLPRGSTDPGLVPGSLVSDRMVYIAHDSPDDVAVAVAATVAGYPPHVSMVLKQVAVDNTSFTSAQIDQLNGSEAFGVAPQGKGVNWLSSPDLLPGRGVYLGEGYTGRPDGKKYIDVQRTIDDISFRMKARLIAAIGSLRLSRSGLRALTVQLETVLDQLQDDGVIEGFNITIPLLTLLDADPVTLTDAQRKQIDNAQTERRVQVLVSVDYAGNIHRIDVDFKFS